VAQFERWTLRATIQTVWADETERTAIYCCRNMRSDHQEPGSVARGQGHPSHFATPIAPGRALFALCGASRVRKRGLVASSIIVVSGVARRTTTAGTVLAVLCRSQCYYFSACSTTDSPNDPPLQRLRVPSGSFSGFHRRDPHPDAGCQESRPPARLA
jgi:hypothetical protein